MKLAYSKIFRDLVFRVVTPDYTHARMSGADLSARSSFTRAAMVRGYHIYNSIYVLELNLTIAHP